MWNIIFINNQSVKNISAWHFKFQTKFLEIALMARRAISVIVKTVVRKLFIVVKSEKYTQKLCINQFQYINQIWGLWYFNEEFTYNLATQMIEYTKTCIPKRAVMINIILHCSDDKYHITLRYENLSNGLIRSFIITEG